MKIRSVDQDIERVLISEEEIRQRVAELGKILTAEYRDRRPVCLCVLRGASFFYTDLCRRMECAVDIDYIAASSYGKEAHSSGKVILKKDTDFDLRGRDVLIVEDIVDSGLTLQYLREIFTQRGAASVKTVAFLDKAEGHPNLPGADLWGFVVPDDFLVGYGLDFADHYRNLPFVGVLKRECWDESPNEKNGLTDE